jgi:hypothetical protein
MLKVSLVHNIGFGAGRHRLISPTSSYSAQTVETMHNSRAVWQESTAGKAAVWAGGRLNLRLELQTAWVKVAPLDLPTGDLRWLLSLFDNPINIEGGSYANGQHRGCALRFSGAERAAVVTGSEVLGHVCTDWTYLGDG